MTVSPPERRQAGQGLPAVPDNLADRRAERRVSMWFWLSTFSAIGFFAAYWVAPPTTSGYQNALLGLTLGLALLFMGIGVVSWGKKLMPHEVAVQEREPHSSSPEEQAEAAEIFNAGVAGSGIARRKLLRRSLMTAGGALALPALAPLRSLGPRPNSQLYTTPWAAGVRLVDDSNVAVRLGDIEVGGFITVFPENHVDDALAPAQLFRLPPGVNHPAPGRENWAYQDHVVYSKLCTHLGCPVGLYEQQTHHLLCPCHQSLFDVPHGCQVLFGPASRPLPQLALGVDANGYFVARSGFNAPVGPGFWERK